MTAPKPPPHYTLMSGDDAEAGTKPVPHPDVGEWQALLDKLKATKKPPPHGAMLVAIYVTIVVVGLINTVLGFATLMTLSMINAGHDGRTDAQFEWLFRVSLKVQWACVFIFAVTPLGRYFAYQVLISFKHRIAWKMLGSAAAVVGGSGALVYVIMRAEPFP